MEGLLMDDRSTEQCDQQVTLADETSDVCSTTRPRPTLEQLEVAIRSSWGPDTTADPEEWSAVQTSRGQCDVTSLVIRHYLGGDLVLARVFIDCVQTEYHWWNRFADGDVDLTRDQFYPHQDVIEDKVFDAEAIAAAGPIKPELLERFDRLLRRVTDQLRIASLRG